MSVAKSDSVKELDSLDGIEANSDGDKELDHVDTNDNQADAKTSAGDPNQLEISEENPVPSHQQEENVIKKKYGGMLPKKPPLISKDHERAFFDSADWALGKKAKGPLEALRPKLQPTPHQQPRARREAYATAVNGEEDVGNDDTTLDDQTCTMDAGSNNAAHSDGQSCCK
ncbi:uncharacterized protein LOC132302862 [Cornus florida]|uniref:uncharacterized protein LOC132302862 n=1 Tax=Cornus florida TaxID=4283 RepID=UPI00289AABFC|nr:uncharacterized protein LOC132302862 [Cornus florida]